MTKRKVKIDIDDLELAFDSSFPEIMQYLDLQTGEIVIIESLSDYSEQYEDGDLYALIPSPYSDEGYDDMVAFIETVQSPHIQEVLATAIQGKRAFGRFKGGIACYPAEEERWYAFQKERLHERITDWLEDENIELI